MLYVITTLTLTQTVSDGVKEQASAASQGSTTSVDRKQSDEIVVTARRGDAALPAETEFNEDDIAADGSDSIRELISNLQPFIDPTGAEPVFLINGKPAGFDTSILSYPVEALTRVAVLMPEAGPRYGARAGARVVNLVLKPKFSSHEAEVSFNAATAGGQYGGSLGATRNAISGDTRWSARVQFSHQSVLLKSARRIPRSADASYRSDSPAELEGTKIVSTLEQFAATANQIDPDDFETLQPSARNVTFGINVARPLGNLTASVNLDAGRNDSDGLRGIPKVLLASPTGSSWSPNGAVLPLVSARALRSNNSVQTLGASLTLSGMVRRVQTSLAAGFSHSNSHDLLESEADVARLQQSVDSEDPKFDPYAPFNDSFLNFRRGYSRTNGLNIRLNLQKPILNLPAGPLSWSFSATAVQGHSLAMQRDNAALTSNRSKYAQSTGQLSVSLPISSRGSAFAAFRDLTIDLSAGRQSGAGGSAETSYGSGVTWAPFAPLQFRGSMDRAQNTPSFDQLNGPIVATVNRIFDYAREEVTETTWTTGGNPLLGRGNQTSVSLAMMVQPLSRQELALNFTYRQFVATDSPAAFPELTPLIEKAFPERVTRDSVGRLLAVDARPISIERQKDANLSSSLTWRLGGIRRPSLGGMALNLAADRAQINLALSYQLRLQSESLIRRGLPVIDRLVDSGTSRHELALRISVGKRAFGGSLNTSWSSPARVTGSDGAFRLTPPLMFNLSLFANVDRLLRAPQGNGWTRRMKVSFDIQNLSKSYRRITLPDGSVPAGYSRDEVDPLGRTVRLTLRKQFQ
ncbi:MAG: hypothetical protein P0Y59_20495 [Candidatus Sphingomonas phytovorans]|nr:hypothetical protein [Sphingomonas sp.]WEJ99285.1 MAG: hypothetical protein P0Y59_20495 [Sphingomonas sp.]